MPGSEPGGTTPFEGHWTSTDIPDNSNQTLVVGGGQAPVVHFEDDYAPGCADHGDRDTLFIADGLGHVQGNRLDVHFPSAGCESFQILALDIAYEYQATTNTLVDPYEIVWHRLP